MDDKELKEEALKKGYRLCKIPEYQCSCYVPYPNINHKNKNGRWKCVDDYEPMDYTPRSKSFPITHCKRKEKRE